MSFKGRGRTADTEGMLFDSDLDGLEALDPSGEGRSEASYLDEIDRLRDELAAKDALLEAAIGEANDYAADVEILAAELCALEAAASALVAERPADAIPSWMRTRVIA